MRAQSKKKKKKKKSKIKNSCPKKNLEFEPNVDSVLS
jgi:hypothetical protein